MLTLATISEQMEANARVIRNLALRVSSQAVTERLGADEFSVIEHICHLRDLERDGFKRRIVDVLTQDDPQLFDFDGAAVARASKYLSEELDTALAAFESERSQNVSRLRESDPRAIDRVGHYQTGCLVTLREVLESALAHDDDHIRRLKTLGDIAPRTPSLSK